MAKHTNSTRTAANNQLILYSERNQLTDERKQDFMHCVCVRVCLCVCVWARTAVNQPRNNCPVNDTFSAQIRVCQPGKKSVSLLKTLLLTRSRTAEKFWNAASFPGAASALQALIHSFLRDATLFPPSHNPAPTPSDAVLSPPSLLRPPAPIPHPVGPTERRKKFVRDDE